MTNALVLKSPDTLLAGPLGNLDAYIERVSRIPVLSRESELELATSLRLLPMPGVCASLRA